MRNTQSAPDHTGKPVVTRRMLLRLVAFTLIAPAILFVCAGTLDWPMAWVYSLVVVASTFGSRLIMARVHPDLMAERGRYDQTEGVKEWDKKIMPLVALVGPLVMLVVAGLNRRFDWLPSIPMPVQISAMIFLILGTLFATWALLTNRFFSATVRIQTERGHSVVSSGPYRFVRHPGYAGAIVADLAGPLALGSFWALVPGAMVIALVIVRTSLEDKTLQAELPGYPEYAQRVRYRLLPGVW